MIQVRIRVADVECVANTVCTTALPAKGEKSVAVVEPTACPFPAFVVVTLVDIGEESSGLGLGQGGNRD